MFELEMGLFEHLFPFSPRTPVGAQRIERPRFDPSNMVTIPGFWAADRNCAWGKSVDIELMPENAESDTYTIIVYLKEGERILKTFNHPPVSVEGGVSVRKTVTIPLPGTEYKEGRRFRIEITSAQFKFNGGFHCPS